MNRYIIFFGETNDMGNEKVTIRKHIYSLILHKQINQA